MDRRKFVKGAALGVVGAGAVAAPVVADTMPKINWRLQSSYPRALTTVFGGAERFTEMVKELTDGAFDIQIFAGGEIVPSLQTIDAVMNDTIEMGHTISAYKMGTDPTWALATGVPFGLNARQQNSWFYHGGGNELLDSFYSKSGIKAFAIGNSGCQMGGWWRKEVNTIEDMQGVKIRISGLGGEILNRIGAVSQTLGPSDIYPALERGTIDAAEWIGPFDDEKFGFVEVAPYYYYPGWWENGLAFQIFINRDQWDSLPRAYQAAIEVASQAINTDVLANYDAVNPAALRSLIGKGAQLKSFSQEILQRCYEEAQVIYEELSSDNAQFKEIFDAMWAFREDQYKWLQVGEFRSDSFNISSVRG